MTLLVDGIGYVGIGTPDVEDAAAFFRDVCQLEVAEKRADTVFLRGDARHHWLVLERRSEPGFLRVGYEVRDRASREEIKRRLTERDVACTPGGSMAEDRVVDAFRFRDPNGIEVEVYEEMAQFPAPPHPTVIRLDTLLHAVFDVEDVLATRDFWHDVLDFRRSDQIEDLACFMRCGNGYHHSVGFLRQPALAGALDHFCVLVPAIDDVMRMLNVARRSRVPVQHEYIRHAASGSISTYLQFSPLRLGIEFCADHAKLEDDHPGRLLLATPSTVNVWNALPPHREGEWTAAADIESMGNAYEVLGDS